MTLEIDIFEVFSKNKDILLHPKKFMMGLKSEKGKKDAFSFFAVTSLVGNVIGVLALLVLLPFLTQVVPQIGYQWAALDNLPRNLLFLVLAYLIGLLGSFVYSGLLLLLLKAFTKKATFNRTYRLYVYSWAPNLLLGWVPLVSIPVFIYSMYIFSRGLISIYSFSVKKSILFIFVLLILAILLNSVLETLALQTTLQ